jgi:plastocyanin
MSQPTGPGPTPPTPPRPSRPTAFIVGAFVVAALVGGAVLYIGITGGFGGVIPGSHKGSGGPSGPNLANCEGKDKLGTFTFSFVGGPGGSTTFNGSQPGPCVAVVVGSKITVDYSVAADAGQNHSWVLVDAANASTALSTPVFPGAGFTGAVRFTGLAPGGSIVFHFNATAVGNYQYICEIATHYDLGMHGWFNVTAQPTTSVAPSTAPHVVLSVPTMFARSD